MTTLLETLFILAVAVGLGQAIFWTIRVAKRIPDVKEISLDYTLLPHRYIDRQLVEWQQAKHARDIAFNDEEIRQVIA